MKLRIRLLWVALNMLFWDIIEAFWFWILISFATIFFSRKKVLEIKEELIPNEDMG